MFVKFTLTPMEPPQGSAPKKKVSLARNQREEDMARLRAQLLAMKKGALRKKAVALGVGEDALEQADDAEDTKAAFIDLILEAQVPPAEEIGAENEAPGEDIVPEDIPDPDGCSCQRARGSSCPNPRSLSSLLSLARASSPPPLPGDEANLHVRHFNSECEGNDVLLGLSVSRELCLGLC